jgi:hypothetical protein
MLECSKLPVRKLSLYQARQRKEYSIANQFKPIFGFWDGIQFTDEARMSLDDFPSNWIWRVIGTRKDPKNTFQHQLKTANVVHFAAWVNYYKSAGELTFYDNKYNDYMARKAPLKP